MPRRPKAKEEPAPEPEDMGAFGPEIDIDEIKAETLAGDLRDALLMRIRDMRVPWSVLPQQDQRELAEAVDQMARTLVRGTVRLFTEYEFPRAVVRLSELKIKGEKIEGKVLAENIELNRNVLGEHVGAIVLMLMVDSDTFMGEREPPRTDPDQPELPTDQGAPDDGGEDGGEDDDETDGSDE